MAQYRMLVSYEDPAAANASDDIVNTFYLDTDALSGADDPQALCDDTAELFAGFRQIPSPQNRCHVRAYDMSDVKPREPVGDAVANVVTTATGGPREVALCLSYFAGRNLPKLRGRLYIGPWPSSEMDQRPSTTAKNALATLANGISGLGGINVQWVQYSPSTGNFTNVSDWWVDDEWDTIRSRGLRGATRLTGTVSG